MDTKPTSILPKLRAFLKQLQVLAWFEIFEKWFGFFTKLLWVCMFTGFIWYIYKEYKKDVYYIQDFKVPQSWVEQGYTGEVVRESIIDQMDSFNQDLYSSYSNVKSRRKNEEDGTQVLSDLNLQGFNLKAITKSILSLLGKRYKMIGGYVTLNDSTQVMAVQMTDQITQSVSSKRSESIKGLIQKATLEIMKVKGPTTLLNYYSSKQDSAKVMETFEYLKQHRETIENTEFYSIATMMNLVFRENYDEAQIWADSLLKVSPNERNAFYVKSQVYRYLIYDSKTDTISGKKYKKLYVENLNKALAPERTNERNGLTVNFSHLQLGIFYYQEKNYKQVIENLQKADAIKSLPAQLNNTLAYAYMGVKDYKNAEVAIKKATLEASNNGNLWDSYGELCALQRKDSMAVVYLKKALESPEKTALVSAEAYKKDVRWVNLRARKDFQKLVK